jgi:hypothetical protein
MKKMGKRSRREGFSLVGVIFSPLILVQGSVKLK